MKLIGDRILLKEIKEVKTSNGLILPTLEDEKVYRVLLTGSKCKLKPGATLRLYEHADKENGVEDDEYFINERFGIKAIL